MPNGFHGAFSWSPVNVLNRKGHWWFEYPPGRISKICNVIQCKVWITHKSECMLQLFTSKPISGDIYQMLYGCEWILSNVRRRNLTYMHHGCISNNNDEVGHGQEPRVCLCEMFSLYFPGSISTKSFKIMRPRYNGFSFADDRLKLFMMYANECNYIEISLKIARRAPFKSKLVLIRIIATSHCLNQ